MKNKDTFDMVMVAEGQFPATREEQIEAWQYLHDTGIAYGLQGWFGRTARELIEQKIINE